MKNTEENSEVAQKPTSFKSHRKSDFRHQHAYKVYSKMKVIRWSGKKHEA